MVQDQLQEMFQEALKEPYVILSDIEDPVPGWPKDLLQYNGKTNDQIELEAKTFHVNPQTNALFIQQYLSRFMLKDEYKTMFNQYMKGLKYGYIFGLIVGVPLFAFAINYMFFKGNRASDVEVNQYLENSKVETFTVNSWLGEGSKQYIVALQRGANSAFLEWFTFYDDHTQKYFNLYTFSYLEKNQQGSQRVSFLGYVNKKTVFTAYVNQNQLHNPKFGTKENPVPIWCKDLLEFNGKTNENIELEVKTFHVNPQTNAIFIQQYLLRFMPKDEYKEMFNQ